MEEIELGLNMIFKYKFGIQDRGCSSVGRAVALQAIGREFESPQLHQPSLAGARAAAGTPTGRVRHGAERDGGRVAQLVRACA